ncbi:hypothetical protein V8C40DRAFT_63550 [Trichoderma camerunense]
MLRSLSIRAANTLCSTLAIFLLCYLRGLFDMPYPFIQYIHTYNGPCLPPIHTCINAIVLVSLFVFLALLLS